MAWEAIAAQVLGSAVKGSTGGSDASKTLSGGSVVVSGGAGDVALSHILDAQNQSPFWTWGGTAASVPNGSWFGGAPVGGSTCGGVCPWLLVGGVVLVAVFWMKRDK